MNDPAGGAAPPPPSDGPALPPPDGPATRPDPPLGLVIAAALHGAFLLARGRPEGLHFIEASPAGALRSFWAAAICLPAFLALRLFVWEANGVPGGSLSEALAVELIGNVVAWVGFALVSRSLAETLAREAVWPRFLAAWNWTSVVQHLVMLGAVLPGGLGVPATVSQALGVAALGYALWLEWFVARRALAVPGGIALAFVLLDLAMGLLLHGFGRYLIGP